MKITLTTIKSFIKKNQGKLFISNQSSFDGMVDGSTACSDQSFRLATLDTLREKHTLGIVGAWFVLSGRDYFEAFEDDKYIGFRIYNSCDRFKLAVKKGEVQLC